MCRQVNDGFCLQQALAACKAQAKSVSRIRGCVLPAMNSKSPQRWVMKFRCEINLTTFLAGQLTAPQFINDD
jgi:hypothetical protein